MSGGLEEVVQVTISNLIGMSSTFLYNLSTTCRPGNDEIDQDIVDEAKEKSPQKREFRELPEKDSNLH